MNKSVKSLLSISQKAGKLVSGETICEKTLRKKAARLVIVASDASDNTKKKFTNKAFFYEVPCLIYGTKEEMSKCIGKDNRTTYIITDENLSTKIKQLIENDVSE